MAIENIVAEDQRHMIAPDKIPPYGEGFRKPARLVLRRKAESYSEFAAVAKQLLKAALVVWRRDDQYIANIGHHKRGQRIIDHRLVVDRQELLRNYKCQRVKPRA